MIVASSADQGNSGILVKLAHDLGSFVGQAVRDGASFDSVERGALGFALKMGHAAVKLFLSSQGEGDLGAQVETPTGTTLHRSETPVERPLRTIFGEHSFRSYVYSRGPHRPIELRPIDARINLSEGKASYLLQEFSQLFCVEKAFGVGARQFETVFRQKLSVDVLEDINRAMGEQADRFLDALPAPPPKEEGSILVATADGKGVPLVQADAQKVPAFDAKERPGNRRMATLGCVYTVEAHVRTPEQIVAALFRDDTVAQPAERPDARRKRYRGFFAEPPAEGEDAVPSAYRTWAWIAQEVTARRQSGQVIVRLMDGQPSLWEAADACLCEVIEALQAKREPTRLVDILDVTVHPLLCPKLRAAEVLHFPARF